MLLAALRVDGEGKQHTAMGSGSLQDEVQQSIAGGFHVAELLYLHHSPEY